MKIDRSNPFLSKIKERFSLTKEGSTKKTYHVVLDLKGSGIEFKVGDSIAICPQNDPKQVDQLIHVMKAQGHETIYDSRSKSSLTLREFLTNKANLTRLTSSFLKLIPEKTTPLLENKPLLSEYLAANEPIDFLIQFNTCTFPLEQLCAQFSPLLPRFYSIASSLKEAPDEVHLTVALSEFSHRGEKRYGVASHFLCHLAESSTPIPLYVQNSQDFTIPEDHSTHIIMIGPGTGVAPFRAFLQERVKLNALGRHWLFFGERNQKSDFFYEDFWKTHEKSGALRLDVAFSRDQEHKHYVQHKIYENSKEIWGWINEGAHIYICGDADPMAKDVELTLHTIAKEQGLMQEDEAKAFLKSLRKQKKLLFDIY